MIVKRVGPVSCAKIAGVLNAIMGLVFGAIVSIVSVVGQMAAPDSGAGVFPALFGAGAVVLLPFLYGCIGFVMTLFMAVVYNLVAGMVGGVEVELQ